MKNYAHIPILILILVLVATAAFSAEAIHEQAGFKAKGRLDVSNVAGSVASGEAEEVRDVFAGDGIRFTWSARPRPGGAEVVGYSYAVDDTSEWTPFSLNATEFPASIDDEVHACETCTRSSD